LIHESEAYSFRQGGVRDANRRATSPSGTIFSTTEDFIMISFIRRNALLPAFLLLGVAAGCTRQQHAAPVNPELARKSLREVLDGWKRGDDLASFRQASPSITVQDMDWTSGYKLLDYEIIGDGKYDDANLLCPVKLKLQDPKGNAVSRDVTYMVGTDPVITVFREMKF
jgi:hypothetical protein